MTDPGWSSDEYAYGDPYAYDPIEYDDTDDFPIVNKDEDPVDPWKRELYD